MHDIALFTKHAAFEETGDGHRCASMGLGEGDGLDHRGDAAQAEEAASRRCSQYRHSVRIKLMNC